MRQKFLTKGFFRSRGVSNFGWLVADKMIRLGAGLLVGLMVARHLGTERFGLLNYALAVVSLLGPLTELGLDPIVRRRLLNMPEDAAMTLSTVWYLRIVAGAVSYAALAAWGLAAGSGVETRLLLVLGFTLLQPAVFTPDSWLQANLHARVSVMVSWAALVAGALVRVWLVRTDAGLAMYAWAAVAEAALGGGLMWVFARQKGMPFAIPAAFWRRSRLLLCESWPLLLSGAAVVFYMRMDVVMVRMMVGEGEAGIYTAAVRLSEAGYFIPMALASSLLPWLLQRRRDGGPGYHQAVQRYYDLSAALGYAVAIPTALLARVLVVFLYGNEYARAGEVLAWHAFAAIFVFLGVARSQYLTNEGRQRFSLVTTALGAVVNLVLNLMLIPTHGALGAAWATVAAYAVAAWGASWLHPELRANAWMQTRALLIPFRWRDYVFRR